MTIKDEIANIENQTKTIKEIEDDIIEIMKEMEV